MSEAAEPIVRVTGLYRVFGPVSAVAGISFDVRRGSVVGFIGANGAGKTTTMRMMATLDAPTAGRVEVCGYDIAHYPNEVRARIGWMPDSFGAYEHVTVAEYLDFYARAYGLKGGERERRLAEVMEFTELTPIADRMMKTLSKGMGQRLCLGRTLLHDPELLILDEPAAGLDPKARVEFRNLIRLLAAQGKTIFISSHILSELGEMCDELLFIDAGRLIHQGTAEHLEKHGGGGVILGVTLDGGGEALRDWVAMQAGVEWVGEGKSGGRLRIMDETRSGAADLLARMIRDGLRVAEFTREKRRLEDAFIDILRDGGDRGGGPPPLPPPLPVGFRDESVGSGVGHE